MSSEFMAAIEQLEEERGISKEVLLEAVETALVKAYKKDFSEHEKRDDFGLNPEKVERLDRNDKIDSVEVKIDRLTGDIKVFSNRHVVNKREIDLLEGEISLEGAQEINADYEIGDNLREERTPRDFGRIAMQTARQVVIQKITEASRDIVYDEFIKRESEIMVGEVVRKGKNYSIIVSLNLVNEKGITVDTEALLAQSEQIPGEKYELRDRVLVYVLKVGRKNGVPQINVSRSHPGFVKRLFEREVPEISDGIVQIKSISREVGSRTKMSVLSVKPEVDAIGACVGSAGNRISAIVNELKGEKIDIVNYDENPAQYILNALNPAKVVNVMINEDTHSARVVVPDYQLSLAIGKSGQNARLAANLTGWRIDIKSETQEKEENENLEKTDEEVNED